MEKQMIIKRITSILVLLICSINPILAETQYELNKAACAQFKKADDSLNNAYKQILLKYKDDKAFINQFVSAQKKWIAFKDAYVASMYVPQYQDTYGSVFPMCQCYLMEQITKDRVKQLHIWLDGVTEGDVCIGSAKN
jgi:uncharacterized protein YecT (DUF1311 family)